MARGISPGWWPAIPFWPTAQGRPNPFRGALTISFSLERAGPTRLAVYDIQGRLVRRLIDRFLPAGSQSVLWDGREENGASAHSGVYFYRLETAGRRQVEKILLLQ